MKPFELTNAAKLDLKKIARFTQNEWGRDQRNLYIRQFDDTFHMLADAPLAGKACSEIRDGYKKFPIGSHIIFYKEGDNAKIIIVRILHKRMDIERNFQMP